jgi:hypothetical protein
MAMTMKITRLYTDPNGESRFEDMDIALEDAGEIGRLSTLIPATGVIFRETDPDYDYDWHPAPRRQFIVMLQGTVEIETGDGARRRFGPGDILLAEDTTGRGHRSRTVDNQVRKTIFVTLD